MTAPEALIAHESAHAAAATVLGYPPSAIQVFADGGGGYVDLPPELDREDAARDFLLVALAGRIGGEEPDWPPDWPPSYLKSCDEKQVALLVDYLQLDKSDWHQLCAEAWHLASSRSFTRLETSFSTALKHTQHLDRKAVAALIGVAVEHKTMKATATTTDQGVFSAIAACYTIDRDGEQIIEGAFEKTIARWQASGRALPLHWNHKGDPQYIIGSLAPDTMRETGEGLYVEGQLDLDDSETARQAWRVMKSNSVGLSFGFLEVAAHERSDGVRELRELDLFEVSIVPAPANPDTRIVSMKSTEGDGVPSHTEVERRLIEEGIIAPLVPHENIAEEAPALMASITHALRRNGDNPEKGALPSDHEQRREAERLGVIPPDPVRLETRDAMLALLLGHDEPTRNGTTDKAQRERAKALGVDDRPIQVASFEC